MTNEALHANMEATAFQTTADDVRRAKRANPNASPSETFRAVAGMLGEETRGTCNSLCTPLNSFPEALDFDPNGRERP